MFVFFVVESYVLGRSLNEIWTERYFDPRWQLVFDSVHSLPFLFLAWLLSRRFHRRNVELFVLSAGFHSVLDIPIHREDAHRHFFPLSDFQFRSPISYWDTERFGTIVAGGEVLLVLALTVYLFPRLRTKLGKIALLAVSVVAIRNFIVYQVLRTTMPH